MSDTPSFAHSIAVRSMKPMLARPSVTAKPIIISINDPGRPISSCNQTRVEDSLCLRILPNFCSASRNIKAISGSSNPRRATSSRPGLTAAERTALGFFSDSVCVATSWVLQSTPRSHQWSSASRTVYSSSFKPSQAAVTSYCLSKFLRHHKSTLSCSAEASLKCLSAIDAGTANIAVSSYGFI